MKDEKHNLNKVKHESLMIYLSNNSSSLISHLSSPHGFTLIEIVVVFSIMAILAGLGFASLSSYAHKQAVTQASNDIAQAYKLAKLSSVSGVKPSQCSSSTLSEYRVVFCKISPGCKSIPVPDYEVDGVCNGVTTQYVPIFAKILAQKVSVTSIVCTSPPKNNVVEYQALTGAATNVPCTIKIAGYGYTQTIPIK